MNSFCSEKDNKKLLATPENEVKISVEGTTNTASGERVKSPVAKKSLPKPTHDEECIIWDLRVACTMRYADEKDYLQEFSPEIDEIGSINETDKKKLKGLIAALDKAVKENYAQGCDPNNKAVLKSRAPIMQYHLGDKLS